MVFGRKDTLKSGNDVSASSTPVKSKLNEVLSTQTSDLPGTPLLATGNTSSASNPNLSKPIIQLELLPGTILHIILSYLAPNLHQIRQLSKDWNKLVRVHVSESAKKFKETCEEAQCWGFTKEPRIIDILNKDPLIVMAILADYYHGLLRRRAGSNATNPGYLPKLGGALQTNLAGTIEPGSVLGGAGGGGGLGNISSGVGGPVTNAIFKRNDVGRVLQMLMEALEFCLMHYETHYRFIPLLKEFGKIYGIQYFHTSTIVEESPTRLAAASTIARGNSLLEGDRDPIDQVHLLKHGVVPTGDQDIAESAHEKDDHPSCDEDLGQGAPTNYSRSRMGFESLARKSSFRNNSASNYEQVNRSVNPNPKPNRNPSEVSLGNQEPTKTSGWLSFNGRLYRLAAQNGHAFNLPICSDLDPTEIVTIISYALTDAIKARSMRAFERILEHSKLSGCFWITLNCGLDTLLELHYSPGRDFNEMMLKSLRMEDPTLYCVSNRVIDMVFEDALGPWVALQNPKLRTMRGSVSAGLDNIQPSAPPSMNQYWGCRMLEEELCDELKTALAIVRKAEHVAELHRIPLSA